MKNKLRYVITIIHITCTFIWSGAVFSQIGINPSGCIVVDPFYSDRAETVITYLITELFACILISLLWKLVFFLIEHFKRIHILLLTIWFLGAVALLILWPEALEGPDVLSDNLVSYACAVRLTPDYWHSIYTSVIYAASMLVLPCGFSVTLVQWSFFMFALSYIFERSEKSAPKLRYLLVVFFVLPDSPELFTYSHRMCQYTIVLMLYGALILFDLLDKKPVSRMRMGLIALFGAFLSVWRSEGIIVCGLLFLLYIVYGSVGNIKKIAAFLGIFSVCFVTISIPQKLGDRKYYGNDYSMINTFEPLRSILNSSGADLAYDGATEDLAALSRIVPVDMIREYGVESYRRINNGVNGHQDINQSCAQADNRDRFMAAYKNIVAHNLVLYAEHHINTALVAAGMSRFFEFEEYSGEHHEIPSWTYCGWTNGRDDLYAGNLINKWKAVPLRARIANKFLRTRVEYLAFAKRTHMYVLGLMILIAVNIFFLVKGMLSIRKSRTAVIIGAASGASLAGLAAVLAVMPVEASIYYFSSVYLFVLYIFIKLICSKRTNNKQ